MNSSKLPSFDISHLEVFWLLSQQCNRYELPEFQVTVIILKRSKGGKASFSPFVPLRQLQFHKQLSSIICSPFQNCLVFPLKQRPLMLESVFAADTQGRGEPSGGGAFRLFPYRIASLVGEYSWSLRTMSIVTGMSRYSSEAITFLADWVVYFLIRNVQRKTCKQFF